jgi:hypothetical protein
MKNRNRNDYAGSPLQSPFEHLYRCNKGKPGAAPPPIPPVTQTAAEVTQASMQQKRDAANRQGYASTLLAGENKLGMDNQSSMKKTLLGS